MTDTTYETGVMPEGTEGVLSEEQLGLFAADDVGGAPTAAPTGGEYEAWMREHFVPMGTWAVFGTCLLFLVPVIGLIFAAVFACGGCRKHQKRALARAFLLVLLFLVFFTSLLMVVFYFTLPALFATLCRVPEALLSLFF